MLVEPDVKLPIVIVVSSSGSIVAKFFLKVPPILAFAVKVMLKVVSNKKLKYVSFYLFALAAAVIIYSLVK